MIEPIDETTWHCVDTREGFEHVDATFNVIPGHVDHLDVLREVWDEDVYQFESLEYERRVVIDVGAHIGAVTIRAALNGADVIAIEPFPEAADMLQVNVSMNLLDSKVNIVRSALTPSGYPTMFIGRIGKSGMGESHVTGTSTEQVASISPFQLRTLLDGRDLALLKIDIEGWEHVLFEPINGFIDEDLQYLLAAAERVTMETHPSEHSSLGFIVEELLKTHSVSAFGNPETGGMIHAYRYPVR